MTIPATAAPVIGTGAHLATMGCGGCGCRPLFFLEAQVTGLWSLGHLAIAATRAKTSQRVRAEMPSGARLEQTAPAASTRHTPAFIPASDWAANHSSSACFRHLDQGHLGLSRSVAGTYMGKIVAAVDAATFESKHLINYC